MTVNEEVTSIFRGKLEAQVFFNSEKSLFCFFSNKKVSIFSASLGYGLKMNSGSLKSICQGKDCNLQTIDNDPIDRLRN